MLQGEHGSHFLEGWWIFYQRDWGKDSFLRTTEKVTPWGPNPVCEQVSESGRYISVGKVCAPGDWRAGGRSFTVSDTESWARVSMEPSVSISTSGPDPGELTTGTPGLWTWGCSHLLPGLPTISCSLSLFSTERSSCSYPNSLGEAAAQLSTRAEPMREGCV